MIHACRRIILVYKHILHNVWKKKAKTKALKEKKKQRLHKIKKKANNGIILTDLLAQYQ